MKTATCSRILGSPLKAIPKAISSSASPSSWPSASLSFFSQPSISSRDFWASEVSLQRDLAIALAEFAPTSQLVANKKLWQSYGVKRVFGKEWERHCYRRCRQHNSFVSWTPGAKPPNSICCSSATGGEFLIPQFGFISSRQKEREPSGRPVKVFSTRPYFLGLEDASPDEIDFEVLRLTRASPGRMVVLCEGRRGEGFFICMTCGAGFRAMEGKHKDPFGRQCSGMLKRMSLGHLFVTDVTKLLFASSPIEDAPIDPASFAYSLGYALLEGSSSVLQVPSSDLNITVSYSATERIPPVILYDNVPGGAGLVARLEDPVLLRSCVEEALQRVSGACGCGEEASCYGCLRTYRNQFIHHELRRGDVKNYLAKFILAGLARIMHEI